MSSDPDGRPTRRFQSHRADDSADYPQPPLRDRVAQVGGDRVTFDPMLRRPGGPGWLPPIDETDPRGFQRERRELVVPRPREERPLPPPAPVEDPLLELKRSALRVGIYSGILVGMLALLIMGEVVAAVVGRLS